MIKLAFFAFLVILVKTQADENQPITNLQPVSKKLKKDFQENVTSTTAAETKNLLMQLTGYKHLVPLHRQ